MKTEDQIKRMLAVRGGNVTNDGGATGAVKIRQQAQRKILRQILELDDDQALCLDCLAVEGEGENWALRRYCPDCRDGVQKRLSDIADA